MIVQKMIESKKISLDSAKDILQNFK